MTDARSDRPSSPRRRLTLALAAGLLLSTLPVATAGAQVPADAVLRDFQPTGDYLLVVDGKLVAKAEIYSSQRAAAFLILASTFESPVLLSPRSGTVESVDLMKVVKKADGTIDILADATLAQLGSFRLAGEEIAFTAYGRQGRLKAKPPLVGSHPRADLVAHSPEYARGAASYSPNPRVLAELRQLGKPVKVRVFFGSWCSTCKRYLPNALRVEEELNGSAVGFEYYGIDSPPDGWKDPELKRMGVTSVPTGVVYVGGREAGRITTPAAWAELESSLSSIVRGAGSTAGR